MLAPPQSLHLLRWRPCSHCGGGIRDTSLAFHTHTRSTCRASKTLTLQPEMGCGASNSASKAAPAGKSVAVAPAATPPTAAKSEPLAELEKPKAQVIESEPKACNEDSGSEPEKAIASEPQAAPEKDQPAADVIRSATDPQWRGRTAPQTTHSYLYGANAQYRGR